jgi:hypothetical protein
MRIALFIGPPGQACCGQMHFDANYRRETVHH